MPREIEIHAGHWDSPNSGASGYLNEVKENRRVGKRVHDILKTYKVPVTYYEDNVSKNKNDNVNHLIAHHNKDTDGLVVSIHFNASAKTSKPMGTEVLYCNPAMRALASKTSQAISKASGFGLIDRGAKYRDNVGVLVRTKEPAILIEVCFVDSEVGAAIYTRDFEKICFAIAEVLAEELGYKLQKEVKPVANTNEPSSWAKEAWEWAKKKGLVDGTDPKGNLTREQYTVIMYRLEGGK